MAAKQTKPLLRSIEQTSPPSDLQLWPSSQTLVNDFICCRLLLLLHRWLEWCAVMVLVQMGKKNFKQVPFFFSCPSVEPTDHCWGPLVVQRCYWYNNYVASDTRGVYLCKPLLYWRLNFIFNIFVSFWFGPNSPAGESLTQRVFEPSCIRCGRISFTIKTYARFKESESQFPLVSRFSSQLDPWGLWERKPNETSNGFMSQNLKDSSGNLSGLKSTRVWSESKNKNFRKS